MTGSGAIAQGTGATAVGAGGAEASEATISAEAHPLVALLNQYFDLNEREDVAFQLGIDWDNLR